MSVRFLLAESHRCWWQRQAAFAQTQRRPRSGQCPTAGDLGDSGFVTRSCASLPHKNPATGQLARSGEAEHLWPMWTLRIHRRAPLNGPWVGVSEPPSEREVLRVVVKPDTESADASVPAAATTNDDSFEGHWLLVMLHESDEARAEAGRF